jgi:hypothetical protein
MSVLKARSHLRNHSLAVLLPVVLAASLSAQEATTKVPDAAGRANSPFTHDEAELPKGPAPRLGDHPDLSGYWLPSRKDKPVGNIGKDLPGYKLPFTAAGEAAHKYNVEHTVDPEALCIVGGLPRHNASGLPFQLLQGADHAVFLTGTPRIGSCPSMGASTPKIQIHRSLAKRLDRGMTIPL